MLLSVLPMEHVQYNRSPLVQGLHALVKRHFLMPFYTDCGNQQPSSYSTPLFFYSSGSSVHHLISRL